jgi:uncharacterized RDD family membrane protein YckC
MAAIDRPRAAHDDIQRIEAAPILVRIAALVIDGVILLLPIALLPGMNGPLTWEESIIANVGAIFVLPLRLLPTVAILALMEGFTGRTIGKAMLGLRVTGIEDGEPIGLLRAIGRRAIMVLESYALFIPSLILIPFNGNADGHLGDRLTGAIVARDRDVRRAFPPERHR